MTINIRGLPDEVHALLKEEAEASHRSLTSIVLQALAEHAEAWKRRQRMKQARRHLDDFRSRLRDRVGIMGDSVELIRQDRER